MGPYIYLSAVKSQIDIELQLENNRFSVISLMKTPFKEIIAKNSIAGNGATI